MFNDFKQGVNMKKIICILLLSFSTFGFSHNCQDHTAENKQKMKLVDGKGFEIDKKKYTLFTKNLNNGDKIAVVNVNGMVCDFCARGIEKTFMKSRNVKKMTWIWKSEKF
ncbi:MAG: hypothetical protein CBC42_04485 [Betaproteobacteria bacterium TMED82]|nr:MAG: hypothetical protein CBC42_04485 [Betaproteobacteria bacterium TMED82]